MFNLVSKENLAYFWGKIKALLDGKADSTHTHNYASSQSAGGPADTFVASAGSDNANRYVYFAYNSSDYTGASAKKGKACYDGDFKYNPSTNVLTVGSISGSAAKLTTARTISIGTGATGTATSFDGSSNITIPITAFKESYMSWGGKNFAGSYGCIDAAMVGDLGANRFMFGKAAGIIVEYSRDAGATWSDYGLTDAEKTALFSIGKTCYIGKADADHKATADYLLRVTVDTNAFGIYTALNKFVIYCTTNGSTGSYCTIDASLENTPDTWVNFADSVTISGWSGYNVINISNLTTYGNTKTSQYGLIRFTFGCAAGSTTYNGLGITRIMGFGGVGWSTPSTMAANGHLYSMDANQNATFPANVSAKAFVENGTAISSKYAPASHSHSNYLTAHQDISGKANKATTLAGYGITDAYTKTDADGRYLKLAGGVASGIIHTKREVDKGTNPSSTQYVGYWTVDKNGSATANRIGGIQTTIGTDGKITQTLTAYKYEAASTSAANIGISITNTGTITTSAPTPPKTDNSTQIATTAWVKSQGYATTAGEYLPISGGKLTGPLTIINDNFTLQTSENSTNIDIGWKWSNSSGAGIGLRGSSFTSNPGGFSIYAKNSSGYKTLDGFVSGGLKWGNELVLTESSTASAAKKAQYMLAAMCTTAAKTQTKVATYAGFELNVGCVVFVNFQYGTYSTKEQATLNINNTGAKVLKIDGCLTYGPDLNAGAVVPVYYDGTYYCIERPFPDDIGEM